MKCTFKVIPLFKFIIKNRLWNYWECYQSLFWLLMIDRMCILNRIVTDSIWIITHNFMNRDFETYLIFWISSVSWMNNSSVFSKPAFGQFCKTFLLQIPVCLFPLKQLWMSFQLATSIALSLTSVKIFIKMSHIAV